MFIRKGIYLIPFLIIFFTQFSFAQMNLTGKSGLIYIPNANLTEVGSLKFGYNYIPIDFGLRRKGINPERVLFANLTIFERFDVSLTFLQLIPTKTVKVKDALGDRQLDFRYLILPENKKRPSIALAFSSPFTIDAAMLTQAIITTKRFRFHGKLDIETTVGYGSPYFFYRNENNLTNSNIFSNFKWQKKTEYKFNNGYLTGPFGGIKLDYQKKGGVMVEWDSQKLNIGAYGIIGKRWTVQAGLLNFDQVMFGSSFAVDLFRPTTKVKKLYE